LDGAVLSSFGFGKRESMGSLKDLGVEGCSLRNDKSREDLV
jgi:hypothetical protein